MLGDIRASLLGERLRGHDPQCTSNKCDMVSIRWYLGDLEGCNPFGAGSRSLNAMPTKDPMSIRSNGRLSTISTVAHMKPIRG